MTRMHSLQLDAMPIVAAMALADLAASSEAAARRTRWAGIGSAAGGRLTGAVGRSPCRSGWFARMRAAAGRRPRRFGRETWPGLRRHLRMLEDVLAGGARAGW